MQPTLTFENNTYIFTLFHEDKKIIHEFKDCFVLVSVGNEKSIPASHLAKILGPSYDGWFYHIYVQSREGEEMFIWLSKEEFEILEPICYN